eukprot:TRINITY_DN3338_c0_g1_i9.p3 TRINITY_DN3338_c0_g1~~TRINITY_DN3338_c0_g1_i9.p3  ORF type:complete len:123 (-),score=46.32 TRINITY_DN3338_c0_g1_i9:528-896(-)
MAPRWRRMASVSHWLQPLAESIAVHYTAQTELCTNEAVVASMDSGVIKIASLETCIQFGASPQQVHHALGSPDGKCFKTKAAISPEAPSDYLYNYFSLGLDLLFDGSTHRLIKVVWLVLAEQ